MKEHEGATPATKDWQDPIVAEVRQARAILFADADNDLDKLCKLLRESERRLKHRIVKRSSRPTDELPKAVA